MRGKFRQITVHGRVDQHLSVLSGRDPGDVVAARAAFKLIVVMLSGALNGFSRVKVRQDLAIAELPLRNVVPVLPHNIGAIKPVAGSMHCRAVNIPSRHELVVITAEYSLPFVDDTSVHVIKHGALRRGRTYDGRNQRISVPALFGLVL